MWRVAILSAVSLLTTVYGSVMVFTQTIPHSIMEDFIDMPASFGPDLPPEGLRAFLVAGSPSDGCSALDKAPVVENFTGNWVVVVARYNCSFEVKVRNAQLAGYDCVIVHNVNSSDLETMSAKNAEDIMIPSVFVSDVSGGILVDQYTYFRGFYVMVNGDMPFNINTHLLLPFAIVVVLCLLIILVFMIVKCIKDRRRARRHRLPNQALKKIPTCKFRKGDPYDTCAICLDDYQEGERLRVLPCAHAYHAVCIDPWLTQNKRVCPVCKRRVLAAGERRRRDSASGSDSDTEPLLADVTQSAGTFDEQTENPFRRAARFMSRLRARQNGEHVSPDGSLHEHDDNGNLDTAPLIPGSSTPDPSPSPGPAPTPTPAVTAVSERRGRRSRRARSAPSPAQTPPTTSRPLLHSDSHSINNEMQGEIGVAALPAPQASSTPHHIDL